MARERKAILYIGRTSSMCGNCRKGADPHKRNHRTVLEYGPRNGEPGCKVTWTHVSSDQYGDNLHDIIKGMRPDLEWVEPF